MVATRRSCSKKVKKSRSEGTTKLGVDSVFDQQTLKTNGLTPTLLELLSGVEDLRVRVYVRSHTPEPMVDQGKQWTDPGTIKFLRHLWTMVFEQPICFDEMRGHPTSAGCTNASSSVISSSSEPSLVTYSEEFDDIWDTGHFDVVLKLAETIEKSPSSLHNVLGRLFILKGGGGGKQWEPALRYNSLVDEELYRLMLQYLYILRRLVNLWKVPDRHGKIILMDGTEVMDSVDSNSVLQELFCLNFSCA